MQAVQGKIYTLDKQFFVDVTDTEIMRGKKPENRPHVCAFIDKNTQIAWFIPCTTDQNSAYDNRIANLIKAKKSNNPSKIGLEKATINGDPQIMVHQKILPVCDAYIKPFVDKVTGNHIEITPKEIKSVEKTALNIVKKLKNGFKFLKKQHDVQVIEQAMLQKQSDITLHATYTTESSKHPNHTLLLQQGNEYVIIGDQAAKNAELLNIPTSTITTGIKPTDTTEILCIPQKDLADVLKILSANQSVAVSRPSDGTSVLYPKTTTKGDVNMNEQKLNRYDLIEKFGFTSYKQFDLLPKSEKIVTELGYSDYVWLESDVKTVTQSDEFSKIAEQKAIRLEQLESELKSLPSDADIGKIQAEIQYLENQADQYLFEIERLQNLGFTKNGIPKQYSDAYKPIFDETVAFRNDILDEISSLQATVDQEAYLIGEISELKNELDNYPGAVRTPKNIEMAAENMKNPQTLAVLEVCKKIADDFSELSKNEGTKNLRKFLIDYEHSESGSGYALNFQNHEDSIRQQMAELVLLGTHPSSITIVDAHETTSLNYILNKILESCEKASNLKWEQLNFLQNNIGEKHFDNGLDDIRQDIIYIEGLADWVKETNREIGKINIPFWEELGIEVSTPEIAQPPTVELDTQEPITSETALPLPTVNQSDIEIDTIKKFLETISILEQRGVEESQRFTAMFEELSNNLNLKVEATHLTTIGFDQKFQSMLNETVEPLKNTIEQQAEIIAALQTEISKRKEEEDLTPHEQEELDNLQSDISEMQADQKERKGLLTALFDALKALANKLKEVGISAIDKTAEFLHVRDIGNKIVDNEQKVIDRANGKIDKITAASNKYHEGLHDIKEGIKGSFGKEMQDYTPKTGVIANMRIALHKKTIALSTAVQNIGEKVLDFCNNLEHAAQKAREEVAKESNPISEEIADRIESTNIESAEIEDELEDTSLETIESMQDEMIDNQQNEIEFLKAEIENIKKDYEETMAALTNSTNNYMALANENKRLKAEVERLSPPPPPTQTANYNKETLQELGIDPNYKIQVFSDKTEQKGNIKVAEVLLINPNYSASLVKVVLNPQTNDVTMSMGADLGNSDKAPFVTKYEDLTPALKDLVNNINHAVNVDITKQQQHIKSAQSTKTTKEEPARLPGEQAKSAQKDLFVSNSKPAKKPAKNKGSERG